MLFTIKYFALNLLPSLSQALINFDSQALIEYFALNLLPSLSQALIHNCHSIKINFTVKHNRYDDVISG